jgi:hypothetical protein
LSGSIVDLPRIRASIAGELPVPCLFVLLTLRDGEKVLANDVSCRTRLAAAAIDGGYCDNVWGCWQVINPNQAAFHSYQLA